MTTPATEPECRPVAGVAILRWGSREVLQSSGLKLSHGISDQRIDHKPYALVNSKGLNRGDLALTVLSWRDSNPHRRNQNPTCYHYTTRQSMLLTASLYQLFFAFSKASAINGCKVTHFFQISKIFPEILSGPQKKRPKNRNNQN